MALTETSFVLDENDDKQLEQMCTSDEQSTEDSDKNVNVVTLKYRWQKTTALYACFIALGVCTTVHQPTLVNLEILLHTDIATVGATYIGGSLGYMLGAIASGGAMDRYNREFLFATSGVIVALGTILLPWSPHIGVFGVIYSVRSIAMGAIDAGGQAYLLSLWINSVHKDPLMQALHSLWSLGSLIGPLLITPFLVPLPEDCTDDNSTLPYLNLTTPGLTTATNGVTSTGPVDCDSVDVSFVRYGFLVVGSASILGSVFFYILFFVEGPSMKLVKVVCPGTKDAETPDMTKNFKIFVIVIMAVFFFSYAYIEEVTGGFAATFVVKGFGWDVHMGGILTSVFWGSLGFGRLICIPLSALLRPAPMLMGGLFGILLGLLLIGTLSHIHNAVIWVGFVLSALFMAPMFPSSFLWLSINMNVSGVTSSIMLVGTSLGSMSGNYLGALLFQTVWYMWVILLPIIATIFSIMLLLVLFVSTALCLKRSPRDTTASPMDVTIITNTGDVTQTSRNATGSGESPETSLLSNHKSTADPVKDDLTKSPEDKISTEIDSCLV